VFFVASACDLEPEKVLFCDDTHPREASTELTTRAHGFYWTEGVRGLGWAPDAVPTLKNGSTVGIPSPPAILLPSGKVMRSRKRALCFSLRASGTTRALSGIFTRICGALRSVVHSTTVKGPGSFAQKRDGRGRRVEGYENWAVARSAWRCAWVPGHFCLRACVRMRAWNDVWGERVRLRHDFPCAPSRRSRAPRLRHDFRMHAPVVSGAAPPRRACGPGMTFGMRVRASCAACPFSPLASRWRRAFGTTRRLG
jgi:hypothetical protein